jgi:hypothetical protein
VSRSLIGFQVRVHRRDAENTETAQRPDSRTLRPLCGLGASAVKWRLQNYDVPKIVTRTPHAMGASTVNLWFGNISSSRKRNKAHKTESFFYPRDLCVGSVRR